MTRPQADLAGPDVQSRGPWPFVTHRSFRRDGRRIVWRARQARKGLEHRLQTLQDAPVPVWRSRRYNWTMGLFFAFGSTLFMLGAGLSLPPLSSLPVPTGAINVVFFAGSIPFTIAAYLQHFQAANAPDVPPAGARPRRVALIGWRPGNPGWLSSFAQFLGTIQFNFNTFDAIVAPDRWYVEDIVVWTPGMVGSVLFLISGYLAFIETAGSYWSWKPQDLDWRIAAWNLLGCVFFLTASTLAFVPEGPERWWLPALANLHLLLGGFGFLVGSALMMHESRMADPAAKGSA